MIGVDDGGNNYKMKDFTQNCHIETLVETKFVYPVNANELWKPICVIAPPQFGKFLVVDINSDVNEENFWDRVQLGIAMGDFVIYPEIINKEYDFKMRYEVISRNNRILWADLFAITDKTMIPRELFWSKFKKATPEPGKLVLWKINTELLPYAWVSHLQTERLGTLSKNEKIVFSIHNRDENKNDIISLSIREMLSYPQLLENLQWRYY